MAPVRCAVNSSLGIADTPLQNSRRGSPVVSCIHWRFQGGPDVSGNRPEKTVVMWLFLRPRFINTTTFAARDFSPRRGASDAHTLQRSVRSEQRRLGQKELPPKGLRCFSVLASLLLGHSPTSGDAPSSRLARTENRRNKRGRIYGTGYLARIFHLRMTVSH